MAACWWACRCRPRKCRSFAASCMIWAIPFGTRATTRRTSCSSVEGSYFWILAEISRRNFGGVAHRGTELGAPLPGHAKILDLVAVAAVYAALRDHVVHRNVPRLGMDGIDRADFEGDADYQRFPVFQSCQRAVEKAAAVTEAIALLIESVHRQQYGVRHQLGACLGIGDVELAQFHFDSGMPFPEKEGRLRRAHYPQRGGRCRPAHA